MLESNTQVMNNDLKTMVKDAKVLLNAATAMSGEKAEAVRKRGMRLLSMALTKAREKKELADSMQVIVLDDKDVLENLGFAIICAVGLGILAGFFLG